VTHPEAEIHLPEHRAVAAKPELDRLVRHAARPWAEHPYYDQAERSMDGQWERQIWPLIKSCDFEITVDLACGHGRNSEKLRHLARRLVLVDVHAENIEFCKKRFHDAPHVSFARNDGHSLPFLDDGSVTLVYCFDAMVHFDSEVVRSYLGECRRVLRPGGRAFLHHSNYTGNPGGDVYDNPGWRNFMSVELMAHYAVREGLTVLRQQTLDRMNGVVASDAFTLLESRRRSVA
jgi:SAM-dependent methyltransferase